MNCMFEFNDDGNLNGGIIKGVSLDKLREVFVNEFPDSKTRKRNFEGLIEYIDFFEAIGIYSYISKVWLDGSFLTNKLNPNDIDLVVLFNPINGSKVNHFFDHIANSARTMGLSLYCDPYFSIDHELIPPNHEQTKRQLEYQNTYWLGMFGFDRNGKNKGIIEICFNKEG